MTKKYLIIGDPINHSLSPKIHNYWFKQNSINADYAKKKPSNEELIKIIEQIRNNELSGINITIPFKQRIIPFLDKLSDLANKTQSVNTVYKKDDTIIGDNTDIFGFENSLREKNFNLKNKSAFIFGAGGVVPSIIFGLQNLGFKKIFVTNRTHEKLEKLKKQFPLIQISDWGEFKESDLIINATSLGLKNEDKLHFNFEKISKKVIFYDVIYNPSVTNFLKEAEKNGNVWLNGKMMFVYQAQKAFELWTGKFPKIDDKLLTYLYND
jgi:shikimate dehydrogenase